MEFLLTNAQDEKKMGPEYNDKFEVRLEALADLQVPRDLCISPDGTQTAYTLQAYSKKGEHATSALWIAKVGEENTIRVYSMMNSPNGLLREQ